MGDGVQLTTDKDSVVIAINTPRECGSDISILQRQSNSIAQTSAGLITLVKKIALWLLRTSFAGRSSTSEYYRRTPDRMC